MNQPVRTSKSASAVFGAGLALGAIAMVGVMKGGVVTPAQAGQSFKARTIGDINVESMTELRNLDNSIANLADFVEPAVVDIKSTSGRQTGPDGERMPEMGGEGSGFIIRPDGLILTNDHVVGGFDHVMVTLKDGRTFTGHVTRAEDSDIALVKIDATNLPTLSFANSDKVRPGQMSMAIGAPFSLTNSVTVGHVSALGREKIIEGRLYPTLIQTDTAINMGNSGGPLVNIEGQVIGVNTAIYSPSGVSSGIGFAIPANQAKLIADTLSSKGKVTRSMLGLYPQNMTDYDLSQKHLTGGAIVESLTADGPAKAAGIEKGDIVVKIGATPIRSELDLRNAMMTYAPGTTVPIEIVRNGTHKTVHATLKAYVAPPKQEQQIQEGPDQTPDQQQFQVPKGFQLPPNFRSPFNQPGAGYGGEAPTIPHDGKAHLGVSVGSVNDELRSEFNIPAGVSGAVVVYVVPGGIAEKVGLTPGDVITSFAGKKVTSAEDLTAAVKEAKVGDTIPFHYTRFSDSGSSEGDAKVTFK
jgi:serine protease Do